MPARTSRRSLLLVAGLGALALGLAGCDSGGGSTIDITLQEFAVVPSESSVGAGEVTFDVTNEGPDDEHEFVVFQTDLAPDALPTAEDGSVDEEGEGLTLIGEIEGIQVDEAQSLTVTLDAGNYVLICNIYDPAEDEAHYQEGMFTAFTAE